MFRDTTRFIVVATLGRNRNIDGVVQKNYFTNSSKFLAPTLFVRSSFCSSLFR